MPENLIVKNCEVNLYPMDFPLVAKQRKCLEELCKNDNITISELSALQAVIALLDTTQQQQETWEVTFPEIDFTLLKKHKIKLVSLSLSTEISNEAIDTIEGMLNFLDTIQDKSVEKYNLPKNRVYHFTRETVEHAK